ncbi:MAG: phosphoglucosamine mutase [Clostridia bacterium]|nr:phosphoglucosamine mutase [Clostridia bacterium]
MPKYFGTDGFRGRSGEVLNADHAYRIGRFLGCYYRKNENKPRVVIGKDTRLSSYSFEYAVAAGLTASGADAYMLHVIPTPGVSFAVRQGNFDCGVMISASHNPYTDNGIKLVDANGEKMDDGTLCEVEKYLDGEIGELPFATDGDIGRIVDYSAGRNRYTGYLVSLAANSFKSLKIGLDCANGASWMIAPAVFEALGAKVSVIGAMPDGTNINNGYGSTHIERLCDHVKRAGLDMGFSFDGDADRCLAVDEHGEVVNGDHILYILAKSLKEQGMLAHNTAVVTVMSNLGLFRALDAADIRYDVTPVGDRFLWESMSQNGYRIGAEQSGHVILSKYATTGDGILTAIMLTETVLNKKTSLSKLASDVKMLPQVTQNLRVASKEKVMKNAEILGLVKSLSKGELAGGRILLRQSGTEPVVRVMVEADTSQACKHYAELVISRIKELGLHE